MKETIRFIGVALVISLLLIGNVFADNKQATHTISVTIPEQVYLSLSLTNVTFDFTDREDDTLEESLEVTYRCNKAGGDWRLAVSGTDFTSNLSPDSFSVGHLQWKTEGESYQPMPETASEEVGAIVATGNNPAPNKTKVYYQMSMPTDVHAGDYTNTITYTLLVP